MRFLSMVRSDEQQGPPPQALLDAMEVLIRQEVASGTLVQTGGLAPGAAGFRVRVDGGKLRTFDGPFAEAKEVIGGFAILEAPDLEAALAATRRFLALHVEHFPGWTGECEVRELVYLAP